MPPDPPPREYTEGVEVPERLTLRPIGVVRSPHRERHGTPRQACVPADPSARPREQSRVVFEPEYRAALADLEGIERVWVIAWLHLNQGWKSSVVPPRGPRAPRGLFSTRAPHRPNPIGLSCARVVGLEPDAIVLARVDLLDGTPVLDIKPYVPDFDAFPDASAGWIDTMPER